MELTKNSSYISKYTVYSVVINSTTATVCAWSAFSCVLQAAINLYFDQQNDAASADYFTYFNNTNGISIRVRKPM